MIQNSKILIFLCAGDENYHLNNHWFNIQENNNKIADLLVCFYGNNDLISSKYEYKSDLFFRMKGPKFQLIRHAFNYYNKLFDLFEYYDFFWLADDDIYITSYDLLRFFKTCLNDKLIEIAQPAMLPFNYSTDSNVVKYGQTKPRKSFVELGAPLIRNDIFKKIYKVIDRDNCKCGYGLDSYWSEIFNTYVIDNCTMYHTRPVTLDFSGGFWKTYNINPQAEKNDTIACYKQLLG